MIVSTIYVRGHECTMDERLGRRRRRTHSSAFKAEAVAACLRPGASIAAAAMERSINANLLRRWVLEAERAEPMAPSIPRVLSAPGESFVAVPIRPPSTEGAAIQIEVRRGALTVILHWPSSALHECALWLRELLK
jgi:transposase